MYILIAIVFVGLLWWFGTGRRGLKLPPFYPDRYPLIESTHVIFGDTKHLFQLCLKIGKFSIENGGAAHAYVGPYHIFILTDPDACFAIMNNTNCIKGWAYGFVKPWVGEGLITTNNLIRWKLHRKLASPAFKLPILEGYLNIYNKQINRLTDILDKKVGKGPFEHAEPFEDFALETMYQTTMGFDEADVSHAYDEKQAKAVRTMLNIVATRCTTILWHSSFLFNHFSSLKKKQDEVIAYMHRTTNEVIQRKQKLRERNKTRNETSVTSSFLDVFLDASEKYNLTDEEIREEVSTMMAAGSDTTSTMLIFSLMLLGSHPEIQEQVYQELLEVFEGSTRDVVKDDLPKLVLLEGVIMETTRLYPIIPALPRYCNEDVVLKNYTIPAGTEAFILTYHLHRDPSVWGPEASEFCPKRWSTPGAIPTHPGAFFGFGVGKRSCIGKVQAIITLKATLAHLLRRYRVSADLSKLELQVDVLLKPASGCEISLEAR